MSATANFRNLRSMRRAFTACLLLSVVVDGSGAEESQRSSARVELMANVPEPLAVRDWPQASRHYHDLLFEMPWASSR